MQSRPDEPIAYLNGELIPFREAKLPIFDLGVVQGATIAERLRTFRHQPFQLKEHFRRLMDSASKVNWLVDPPVPALIDPMLQVVAHNCRLIGPEEDLSIVVFVTPGPYLPDANGMADEGSLTTCIYTAPLPLARYARWYESGVHLLVPSIRHVPPESLDPHIKTRSRMNWYLADREVRWRNPDAMALLLDLQGNATETSSGNLFIVRDGGLVTPPAETTLQGTAQQFVFDLAEKLNLPAVHDVIPAQDVLRADEVFLTSSTYCIAPVADVEDTPIGEGVPGVVAKKLLQAWSSAVDVDIVEQARRTR